MKYIVKPNTDLYGQLFALKMKAQGCKEKALELANELGATNGAHSQPYDSAGGGITGCVFQEGADARWKLLDGGKRLYQPKLNIKEGKELWARMTALPYVSKADLNKVVKYTPQTVGNVHYWGVGFIFKPDYILVDIPDEVDYEPIEDMQEILTSQFKTLSKDLVVLIDEALQEQKLKHPHHQFKQIHLTKDTVERLHQEAKRNHNIINMTPDLDDLYLIQFNDVQLRVYPVGHAASERLTIGADDSQKHEVDNLLQDGIHVRTFLKLSDILPKI